MNTLAKLVLVAVSAVVLAGCGGGLRVIKPEVDDAAAIQATTAFHVAPVKYDFDVPAEWEIKSADWPSKTADWSRAFAEWTSRTDKKPVYVLAPGSTASTGARIDMTVTNMKLGTYSFFVNMPGRIWGTVTITDIKSGKVIFKGSFDSPGNHEGSDMYAYEGRVKQAHRPVAEDLTWLINREAK